MIAIDLHEITTETTTKKTKTINKIEMDIETKIKDVHKIASKIIEILGETRIIVTEEDNKIFAQHTMKHIDLTGTLQENTRSRHK